MTVEPLPMILYDLENAVQACSGVSKDTLRREWRERKLTFVRVRGSKKQYITADELRRWANDLEKA
ncbi:MULTISPECIES: hypothetical protein [unclassified Gordonia (in: high G+C Gram-positive bacteria)]|uniref:hypothetical protein n=1 Tax=unclassified Gordonia (in: high G+C Gram-positive bacteria) TaxID=2657482 RepID=UPI000AAD9B51|nr:MULTISPECIES: hypothetical protein [unclassified Gordonia (in: high G+C Gram-positive bacteria)]